MKVKSSFIAILLTVCFFNPDSFAQPVLQLTNYASGFNRPVDIVNAGDNRLFIVEQPGVIKIIDSLGNTMPTAFLNISASVTYSGEQGLLGLCFHPNYASNGYFYVNYVNSTNGRKTRISRFSVNAVNPNIADPGSELILLEFSQPFSNHNAGDIVFGPDGYLYIGTGDGGSGGDPQNSGQTLNSLLGKLLRIDVDSGATYSIPPDNPFVGVAGAAEEVYCYGLRNPWRISFDSQTGDLWIGDVGQNNIEEIDVVPAGSSGGENFGWRCYEGNSSYNTSGCGPASSYVPPVFQYTHSLGSCLTGGFMYRGQLFPFLEGHYVLSDYSSGRFWTLYEDSLATTGYASTNQLLNRDDISTFGEDVIGELYAADLFSGVIYHVTEACQNLIPTIVIGFDTLYATFPTTPTTGINYQWYLNGNIIAGATGSFYKVTVNGTYSVAIVSANGCTLESEDEMFTSVNIPENLLTGEGIVIIPNPTLNSSVIYFNYREGQDYLFTLFDMRGRQLRQETVRGGEFIFEKKDLQSGQYILEIAGDIVLKSKILIN